MCLPVPHIRLKHHIVDHRGYKPSICATHKSICVFFCASCQVVFCRFCTEKHCVHIFSPVKVKALEIRKNIFSAMTGNEEKAKPLRHQNFVLREFGKQCEPICDTLKPEKVTNTLRNLRKSSETTPKTGQKNWQKKKQKGLLQDIMSLGRNKSALQNCYLALTTILWNARARWWPCACLKCVFGLRRLRKT